MVWTCTSCGGENPEGTRFCGHCGAPSEAIDQSAAPAVADERETQVTEALRSFVSGQVADRLVEGDLAEERRLVTCLFADLSGFTPLADRLDPEELLEVIDPVIKRLTDVVGDYEGYVDKFAGDALLAFFGAPVAHEDDAERALMVGIEMHHALEEMLPNMPEYAGTLTLHIGVNSGRVVARVLGSEVRMDYSVLGDAVILAQRLESAAPAGETYVGMTTHLLTRDRFEFESVGELTLKGKAKPVSAWRLVGRKKSTSFVKPESALIGRGSELAQIASALESLSNERGSLISLSGEPGVGKSRLVAETRALARETGAAWMSARCLSYGAGIAYWPYADLLKRIAGIGPKDPPEKAAPLLKDVLQDAGLESHTAHFSRLLGLPSPELDELSPEVARRELHGAFASTVRHLTSGRPLVLALEDVHWSDASSIALTTDLAALCEELPFILLVTARTEAVPVLLEIGSSVLETSRHALQLDPLDDKSTRALVEASLEDHASDELVNVVAERAAGNPFFVQELLRSLQDTQVLQRSYGMWTLPENFRSDQIPPTIEGVLSARIDVLPRRAASVLQLASVIGRRVRVPLLRGIEASATDLDDVLKELIGAGFLDEPSEEGDSGTELTFHHALVQDVAYSRLLRRDRRELHLKVAEVAEELYGAGDDVIDLLARHLHLAEAGAKAVDYLVRAGERAKRLFANDEALIHLGHALEMAQTDQEATDRIPEIVLSLGDLHELRGSYDEALDLYGRARQLNNSIRAWRGQAAVLRNQAQYPEALQLIDEASESGTFSGEELAQLWLERGWVLFREGQYKAALAAFQEGLDVGNVERQLRAELLMHLARSEDALGDLDLAIDHALNARDLFEQLGDIRGLAAGNRVLGGVYLAAGRLDEAAETLKKGLELAKRTGGVEEFAGGLINLGVVEMERENLHEAIEWNRQALEEFERIDHLSGKAIAYGNLAEALMLAGESMEALRFTRMAIDVAREIGHVPTLADASHTQARIHMSTGDYLEAGSVAIEAAEIHLEMGSVDLAVECLTLAAQAMSDAGENDRALDLLARARSLSANEN